ncbi:hypothetical protein CFOL_v3_35056 [Cephalotus follicularis]|uniref:Uncharacterized protein n=1 Tax=Cephalotus follicularis TaxID=3775 RepID=A0A1Q3DGL0_CEPFO|nr:hypothetical protein CFOL_v3_35056 [Cephalotus follicularis]
MDSIISTFVSFLHCSSWRFCQLQGKNMPQTCWLWSGLFIDGSILCLYNHTKKKGFCIRCTHLFVLLLQLSLKASLIFSDTSIIQMMMMMVVVVVVVIIRTITFIWDYYLSY